MATALEGTVTELKSRQDLAQNKLDDYDDHLRRLDIAIVEIRNDIKWIRWLLAIIVPSSIIQLIITLAQLS
ncbi:MAG: hypothetical protein F4047_18645 [Caldilineaceae bacterium SB0670_bin_27]|uniref:Haemolysin XhlA n=1 Tax=Caldilineaceae bacterium SB0664_bin_27 TaxID=2605260 RepID=A0A6B0YST6_9CHLR|nr:hypothetical protein [Caldilineaceae bacterium SB0664_bin_27]MYJ80104.1 hypothetical protein [Caldilineaceae bacterium SB0670_bin_27]